MQRITVITKHVVEKVVITKWKASDGTLFDTEELALAHEVAYHQRKQSEGQKATAQQEAYEAAHLEAVKLYLENGWPFDKCNCGAIRGDEACLKEGHLCTCKTGRCKRHTSLHFKNTGCFWCNYTDCSLYGC